MIQHKIKKANIRPLLKKPNLDKGELKNYRPVSNLPFLSKILERLVATETALLKVHRDIVEALDRKCMAALVLLDLSTAFDVIDHNAPWAFVWSNRKCPLLDQILSE